MYLVAAFSDFDPLGKIVSAAYVVCGVLNVNDRGKRALCNEMSSDNCKSNKNGNQQKYGFCYCIHLRNAGFCADRSAQPERGVEIFDIQRDIINVEHARIGFHKGHTLVFKRRLFVFRNIGTVAINKSVIIKQRSFNAVHRADKVIVDFKIAVLVFDVKIIRIVKFKAVVFLVKFNFIRVVFNGFYKVFPDTSLNHRTADCKGHKNSGTGNNDDCGGKPNGNFKNKRFVFH